MFTSNSGVAENNAICRSPLKSCSFKQLDLHSEYIVSNNRRTDTPEYEDGCDGSQSSVPDKVSIPHEATDAGSRESTLRFSHRRSTSCSSYVSSSSSSNKRAKRRKRKKKHKHHHRHRSNRANDSYQQSTSPTPKVNPIFVWIKQDDTKIVQVLCEDYDRRNRIRLTRTAAGWRSIPLTKSLEKCWHTPKTNKVQENKLVKLNIPKLVVRNNLVNKRTDNYNNIKDHVSLQSPNAVGNCDHSTTVVKKTICNETNDLVASSQYKSFENSPLVISKHVHNGTTDVSLVSSSQLQDTFTNVGNSSPSVKNMNTAFSDINADPFDSDESSQDDLRSIINKVQTEALYSDDEQTYVSSIPDLTNVVENSFDSIHRNLNAIPVTELVSNSNKNHKKSVLNSSESFLNHTGSTEFVIDSNKNEEPVSDLIENTKLDPDWIDFIEPVSNVRKNNGLILDFYKNKDLNLNTINNIKPVLRSNENTKTVLNYSDNKQIRDFSGNGESALNQITSFKPIPNSNENAELVSDPNVVLRNIKSDINMNECESQTPEYEFHHRPRFKHNTPMSICMTETKNYKNYEILAKVRDYKVEPKESDSRCGEIANTVSNSEIHFEILTQNKNLTSFVHELSPNDERLQINSEKANFNQMTFSDEECCDFEAVTCKDTAPCHKTKKNAADFEILPNNKCNEVMQEKVHLLKCESVISEDNEEEILLECESNECKIELAITQVESLHTSLQDNTCNENEVDSNSTFSNNSIVNFNSNIIPTNDLTDTDSKTTFSSIATATPNVDIILSTDSIDDNFNTRRHSANYNLEITSISDSKARRSPMIIPSSDSAAYSTSKKILNRHSSGNPNSCMIPINDSTTNFNSNANKVPAIDQTMCLNTELPEIKIEKIDSNEDETSTEIHRDTTLPIERLECEPEILNDLLIPSPKPTEQSIFKNNAVVLRSPLCQTLKTNKFTPRRAAVLRKQCDNPKLEPLPAHVPTILSQPSLELSENASIYKNLFSHNEQDEPLDLGSCQSDLKPELKISLHPSAILNKENREYLNRKRSRIDLTDGKKKKKSRLLDLLTSKAVTSGELDLLTSKAVTIGEIETAPLEELRIILSNPKYTIPDPLLVPKARLSALISSPGKEIPRLIAQRTQDLSYFSILTDPDVLVVSLCHLQSLLRKPMNEEEIQKYQKKTEEIRSRLRQECFNNNYENMALGNWNQCYWLPSFQSTDIIPCEQMSPDLLSVLRYTPPLSVPTICCRDTSINGFDYHQQLSYQNDSTWQEYAYNQLTSLSCYDQYNNNTPAGCDFNNKDACEIMWNKTMWGNYKCYEAPSKLCAPTKKCFPCNRRKTPHFAQSVPTLVPYNSAADFQHRSIEQPTMNLSHYYHQLNHHSNHIDSTHDSKNKWSLQQMLENSSCENFNVDLLQQLEARLKTEHFQAEGKDSRIERKNTDGQNSRTNVVVKHKKNESASGHPPVAKIKVRKHLVDPNQKPTLLNTDAHHSFATLDYNNARLWHPFFDSSISHIERNHKKLQWTTPAKSNSK